ncbi:hypothetical protein KGF54_003939 [Candida jiufengensis]|uniref:uncharacterized protein n=1 Tax=Candida jiufengensis TaxID=497108 RepID=UPI0022253F03|nr:uncharacterized protein KGF54_003939 [Candida jiufengensis]KAI5950865.1 hypothetical protein KGF54_003939 [Candida jiufengensis]
MTKSNLQTLHVTTKHSQNGNINSFEIITNKKNNIPPKEIVDELFDKLLSIRNFSKEARTTLLHQSIERKWELILREYESNSSFDISIKSQHFGGYNLHQNIGDYNLKERHSSKDNLPEWFISQIMANKFKLKDLKYLEKKLEHRVSMKESKYNWIKKFISLQGDAVVTTVLSKIGKKSIKSNEEFDMEYLLIKCIRHIIEFKKNENLDSNLTKSEKSIIQSLIRSIRSPRISTRILVTEVLINLLYSSFKEENFLHIFSDETNKFVTWFDVVKSSLSKSWSIRNDDSYLANYFTFTLILINSITQCAGSLRKRLLIRQDFMEAGIDYIFGKAKNFKDNRIRDEIEKYILKETEDQKLLKKKENKSLPKLPSDFSSDESLDSCLTEIEDCDVDTTELTKGMGIILKKLSSQEHKSGDIEKIVILLESMLNQVTSNEQLSNVSIQRLIDGLASEVTARKAISECQQLQKEIKLLKESNELLKQTAQVKDLEERQNLIKQQADKLESQKKQIHLLQRQIKRFEEDKNRKPRHKIINHSFEDLAETRNNSPKKITDELNSILGHATFADLKDSNSTSFHRGPPTPPGLSSKKFSRSDLTSPPKAPNFDKFYETNDSRESIPTSSSPVQPSVAPLPPPPPPPILPPFLNSIQSSSPRPPPIPDFLKDIEKKAAPPPPLPDFLRISPSTPAPPPPLPTFLKKIPDSNNSTPPAPPPPPPLPAQPQKITIKPETDSNNSFNSENNDTDTTLLSIRPKVKLKQIHWNKINNINDTFWEDIDNTTISDKLVQQGVFDDVEKIFAASTPSIKKSVEVKETANPNKISFLSRDLAQQFGINLHMFAGIPEEKLILKILRCNSDILENISVVEFFNNDALIEISEGLSKNLSPYSSDPRSKDKPSKDLNELERADRLFLELCYNLRHYWRARSKALLFAQTYQKDYQDLNMRLNLIDLGIDCLKNSENFRNVLSVIKLVGNFMNGASKQALGFKLDTLQRLKFMKDESNSMSFLHYLEKVIRQSFSEYSSFVDEISELNEIQNISTEQLELDCQEMEKNLKIINNAMENGKLSREKDLHPSDRIRETIKSSIDDANDKIQSLQKHLEETMSDLKSIMAFFGEDINDGGSTRDSFFSKVMIFVTEYKKAHVENIQKEEEQKVYEIRKKKIEDVLAKDLQDETKFVDSVEEASAVIDILLEKLRTASHKKERRTKLNKLDTIVTTTIDLDSPTTPNLDIEYESVNNLKRRLTNRKKNNKDMIKTDQINNISRAQVMLHQLRNGPNDGSNDNSNNGSNDDIENKENLGHNFKSV